MINKRMRELGEKRSEIRELFEYGLRRKKEIGADRLYDFSLGNPSVPCPEAVTVALGDIINETAPEVLHGYTSAAGDLSVREAIADYIYKTEGLKVGSENLYMTVGAAAALTSSLGAVVTPGEEVIVLAPYFPEYKVFVEGVGGVLVEVPSLDGTFQPDIKKIEAAINDKTAAIIINSPNNPTGVVISEDNLRKLCDMLSMMEVKLKRDIYIISDEPYRELVYDGVKVPYVPLYYPNTIVCYSYSKSLSLPGERIGYVLVPREARDSSGVYAAVAGAARSQGYVCAPSLLQRVVARCLGEVSDISVYDENRRLLYDSLVSMGFEVVRPDGAFYLFMKSPSGDGRELSERAKRLDILLVPSESFGTPGYVRISYCVRTEQIRAALPAFRCLADQYFGVENE